MNADDMKIEFSPLCGSATHDGITVHVQIYRMAGLDGEWSLEVIDQDGGSTVWMSTFSTDKEAHTEFNRTLKLEGIRSFALRSIGRATST